MKEISNDASALLKLSYEPAKKLSSFKEDLTVSLKFLKDKYQLNFPDKVFEELLDTIKNQSLQAMAIRVRQFFG